MNYKILVVNMKKREDRKNSIIKIFSDINFEEYSFYEAVDGKSIPLNSHIKALFNGNDFGNRKGVIGCALSHYNIWIKLLKDDASDFYVIFEDDFIISDKFTEYFNKSKNYLTDILFLGYHSRTDNKNREPEFNIKNFVNNNYVGGTFGYIITKRGAVKMIEFILKNGIKHGIDYLFKINSELNISILDPPIVFSDWVMYANDAVDSDIQKDFDSFNFQSEYLYVKDVDSYENDITYMHKNSIDNHIIAANKLDGCEGFNSLGFYKSKIVMNSLKGSLYFKNSSDGLYINLDKKIRVKMICNWKSSSGLCDEWDPMSKGHRTWNNIKIVDNDNLVDYYVIINKPMYSNEKFIPSKTIVFQMEPLCGVKRWGAWSEPDPSKFLQVRSHKYFYNNCSWQMRTTYNEFMEKNALKQYNYISTICSSKYVDPGHIKRIDFLKYIELTDPSFKIDIFGADNARNFINYRGALADDNKDVGIIPYKYYFMAENNNEHNYISEKLWEPIISECLCFYWGAPNVAEYIDPMAYVVLDLDDHAGSFKIIKDAIANDLHSQRIDIIRREKHKILNYYNFFPTIERTITMDLWKYKLNDLIKSVKILIIGNCVRECPLKDFGFNVDFIKSVSYENIKNDYKSYLILTGDQNLTLNKLFNYMLFLPDKYSICYIDKESYFISRTGSELNLNSYYIIK